jgi:hypothetical protein
LTDELRQRARGNQRRNATGHHGPDHFDPGRVRTATSSRRGQAPGLDMGERGRHPRHHTPSGPATIRTPRASVTAVSTNTAVVRRNRPTTPASHTWHHRPPGPRPAADGSAKQPLAGRPPSVRSILNCGDPRRCRSDTHPASNQPTRETASPHSESKLRPLPPHR